jgi:hypothetical protein
VILTSSEGERFEFVATLLSVADCAVNQLKADLIEDITLGSTRDIRCEEIWYTKDVC